MENRWEAMEMVTNYFQGGIKGMTNINSVLKSRDIIFADKVPLSQSYGFSGSQV